MQRSFSAVDIKVNPRGVDEMAELGDIKPEVLSAIYEGQRAESLQHRQSIVNSYGFAFAALVALGAGTVAPGALPLSVKFLLTLAIVSICILLYLFVHRQRSEAEKGLIILRRIETHWGVLKCDEASDSSLLPREWCKPQDLCAGLTKGDWYQIAVILVLALLIIAIVWFLPVVPRTAG